MISYTNHRSHKIFMSCDYYIEQRLCIFFNDNSCDCMNLKRQRGYYIDDFIMNTNPQNSNLTEWEKIQKYHLTPNASPFLIYTNRSYINDYLANEYEAMVEYFVRLFIYKNLNDVKDIVIYEERYER